jgi:hypothetical protein
MLTVYKLVVILAQTASVQLLSVLCALVKCPRSRTARGESPGAVGNLPILAVQHDAGTDSSISTYQQCALLPSTGKLRLLARFLVNQL